MEVNIKYFVKMVKMQDKQSLIVTYTLYPKVKKVRVDWRGNLTKSERRMIWRKRLILIVIALSKVVADESDIRINLNILLNFEI